MLTSTKRIKDILHASRALTESCLGSHFSHFGFWKGILTIGAEKEEDASSGLLSLVFTLST